MENTEQNKNTVLLKKVAAEQLIHATNMSNLQNTVNSLQGSVKNLTEGMVRILTIIDNDDKTDTPGMVKQTRDNTERITVLENESNMNKAKIGVAFTIFTAIGAVISYILNIWITNK